MSITREQLISLGFKPTKRGGGLSATRKYDTLIYPIDNTDFIYIGYNQFNKTINNKVLWKSFKDLDGNRITYPVISLGDTGYNELKNFLERSKASIAYKAIPITLEESNVPLAVVEDSSKGSDYKMQENIEEDNSFPTINKIDG